MDFYDWMLALHLLAAFAVAAALVIFTVLVVGSRRATTVADVRTLFRLNHVAKRLVIGGALAVLVLGVVLAIDADEYRLWDGWVIIGIVLWLLMVVVGSQSGRRHDELAALAESGSASESEVLARLREPFAMRLHFAAVGLFVLLVLDMIFKPGA